MRHACTTFASLGIASAILFGCAQGSEQASQGTFAPQYKAQLALATKVLGDVQSQSLGPRPSAMQAMCSAEVALFAATAYLAPT